MVSVLLSLGLLFLEALQELFEALAGPEEDAVEVQTFEPEVGANTVLVLLANVEAQQELPVAVGGELADQPSHHRGLLVQQHGLELARRGRHGLGELARVAPGPPAGRLAPFGEEEVASRAAQERREAGRIRETLVRSEEHTSELQ